MQVNTQHMGLSGLPKHAHFSPVTQCPLWDQHSDPYVQQCIMTQVMIKVALLSVVDTSVFLECFYPLVPNTFSKETGLPHLICFTSH